ncbi:MAG: MBL fold metallo-hydrolase [Candidatus Omnitrophica bacterium]|nr:MBL fold metallo-hydrolase [Candidatus Omnitrophota bacterium]
MILENIPVGALESNCYVLASGEGKEAIIIDPGAQEHKIRKVLERHKLKPALVINTHGHYDHMGADDKFGVPVYIHKLDSAMLKDPMLNLSGLFSLACGVKSEINTLEENQVISCDGIELKVLHIPGHTPGGIALVLIKPDEHVVFTGDTLFCQGIGRSDLEGGDGELLVKAIKEKLLSLPSDTVVYPGHGPSTTIEEEKKENPYL